MKHEKKSKKNVGVQDLRNAFGMGGGRGEVWREQETARIIKKDESTT